jgi:hypothetical protein
MIVRDIGVFYRVIIVLNIQKKGREMNFKRITIAHSLSALVLLSGCSITNNTEVACNFTSGAELTGYDEDSSVIDNIFNSLFLGTLNVVVQGTHRNVSPQSYDNCKRKETNRKLL